MSDLFHPKRVVIIVQARMGATRLPGKPLKEVSGKPLLIYLLERLKRCKNVDEVVVATTEKAQDDVIVDLCKSLNIHTFRGSELDLADRYFQAARIYHADVIVRITADCPLMDPGLVDQMISCFLKEKNIDYLSNTMERTYPRGMDVEVFSFNALEKTVALAKDPAEREHATLFIYRHPELFRLMNVKGDRNDARHRWTVDTQEDFLLIEKLISALYSQKPEFALDDLLSLIENHPEWELINRHIEQKKV